MSNVAHRLTSTISAISSSAPFIGVRGIADWRLWIVDCELKRGHRQPEPVQAVEPDCQEMGYLSQAQCDSHVRQIGIIADIRQLLPQIRQLLQTVPLAQQMV